mgnify:CR=1 FL=1
MKIEDFEVNGKSKISIQDFPTDFKGKLNSKSDGKKLLKKNQEVM